MKKMLNMIVKTAWLCGLLACVSTVQANVITGKFWRCAGNVGGDSVLRHRLGHVPKLTG